MSDRARNWLIFGVEVALVIGYFVAFGYFVTQSEDFVLSRNNGRASEAARELQPSTSLPAEFRFGPDSADNDLLGAGWHPIEETDPGAWTKRPAYVYLPTPSSAGVTLQIDGGAYLAPGHQSVTIVLTVDGQELGRWTARYGEPSPEIVATVPASATEDGLVEVRLDANPAAVPYHYDRSDDKRKVGFLLSGISLAEDSAD